MPVCVESMYLDNPSDISDHGFFFISSCQNPVSWDGATAHGPQTPLSFSLSLCLRATHLHTEQPNVFVLNVIFTGIPSTRRVCDPTRVARPLPSPPIPPHPTCYTTMAMILTCGADGWAALRHSASHCVRQAPCRWDFDTCSHKENEIDSLVCSFAWLFVWFLFSLISFSREQGEDAAVYLCFLWGSFFWWQRHGRERWRSGGLIYQLVV